MIFYIIVTIVIVIISSILGLVYSPIINMRIKKFLYFYHYKDYFQINNLYLYDGGNAFNRKDFHEFFVVKNDSESILTLNQEAISFNFIVGDIFKIYGVTDFEISITSEQEDTILVYTLVKKSIGSSLKYEKKYQKSFLKDLRILEKYNHLFKFK